MQNAQNLRLLYMAIYVTFTITEIFQKIFSILLEHEEIIIWNHV